MFHDFVTETLEYNSLTDYVSLYEGGSSEASYYGDLQPFSYYSTGNELVMKFITDTYVVHNGFMFSFEYVGKLN